MVVELLCTDKYIRYFTQPEDNTFIIKVKKNNI